MGVVIEDGYVPEIYSANWTADEACMDEEEWNEFLENPRVLVITP